MPSGNVGVLDQEHATFAVQNQGADANGEPAGETPINMQKSARDWLECAADDAQRHSVKSGVPNIAIRAGLTN